MGLIPNNIQKYDRHKLLTFLDTTPNGEKNTWAVLGIGITEYAVAYNPTVDSEKWIIEANAHHDHSGNEKQGAVSQKMYKNDPCFEFAYKGCDRLNYKTNILDIDRMSADDNGNYYAELSAGTLVVTQKGGDNATLEYDLYYEGDKTVGTVSFTGDVPTFVPSVEE